MMSRCTSHCGPNSCSCAGVGGGEIMLFGVRVKVDPMRKSVSLNNLSQYEQPTANNSGNIIDESSKVVDDGYVSADDALPHHAGAGRERKRGVPWTEEEHKLFLLGLQKVGKGDWRGISRNFVKTRTPTQVASHAQKYFLRRTNLNRRRRRCSLFDITTDSVSVVPTEERKNLLPCIETSKINPFEITVLPAQIKKSMESPLSNSSRTADLNLNESSTVEGSSLCLTLSLSFDEIQSSSPSQWMSSFSIGESIISVA